MEVIKVQDFIDENILHSKLFDNASDTDKKKAVNNAVNVLYNHLPQAYEDKENIPVDDVAEQSLFMLRLDDTFQRAELGVLGITIDGVYVQFAEMDRTVSPTLLKKIGVTNIKKRKVGSYSDTIQDTYRMGVQMDRYKQEKYRRY